MDKMKKVLLVIGIMFIFGIVLCGAVIYGTAIIDYIEFLMAFTFITLAVVAYFKKHGLGNGIKHILIELLKVIVAICIGVFLLLFLFYKIGWLGDLSAFF